MAGDWIKMRVNLSEDPAVIGMSMELDLDEDFVVGKLHRIWAWADQQTTDGNAHSVTKKWIDRYLRVTGFADAMESQGWLVTDDTGVTFPSFEKHNGQTAKQRALTAKRVAKAKSKTNAKGNGVSVTTALPREEKRREELIDETTNVVSCPEPDEPASVPASEPEPEVEYVKDHDGNPIVFDCCGKKDEPKQWQCPIEVARGFHRAYPGLDIRQELVKAQQWVLAKPANKKTARGMRAFLNRWMSSEQNKNGSRGSPQSARPSPPQQKVNNTLNAARLFLGEDDENDATARESSKREVRGHLG